MPIGNESIVFSLDKDERFDKGYFGFYKSFGRIWGKGALGNLIKWLALRFIPRIYNNTPKENAQTDVWASERNQR